MKIQVLEENNCRVLIAEVDETPDQLFPLLDNFNHYSDEFHTISAQKRKKEFISVRILMNLLLQRTVTITYDNDHKPLLTESPYHISISHSGNWYALIASMQAEVGIDIEKRTQRVSGVSKRFLDEKELDFLNKPGNTAGLEIAWSAKEALYKRIGKEAYDFHTLKIEPFLPDSTGSFRALYTKRNNYFTLHYQQNDLYTLVYCI